MPQALSKGCLSDPVDIRTLIKAGSQYTQPLMWTWSQRCRKNRIQVYSCVKSRDNPPQSDAFACIVNPPYKLNYTRMHLPPPRANSTKSRGQAKCRATDTIYSCMTAEMCMVANTATHCRPVTYMWEWLIISRKLLTKFVQLY